MAVVALVLFTGSESAGVLAARRALAAQSAVLNEPIELKVDTVEMPEPWAEDQLRDLTVGDFGIFAHTGTAAGSGEQWQLAREGWVGLGLDASLIATGEIFGEHRYVAGRVNAGEPGDSAVVWRSDVGPGDWESTFAVSGGHIASLVGINGQLVAVGYEDYEKARAWVSTDGTSWNVADFEDADRAVVNSGTSDGSAGVFVGYQDGSFPLIERHMASIWRTDIAGSIERVSMPDLGSLGFGYSIGGFRLSDGIEGVVRNEQGFIAYTGFLQVWDGFQGPTLEPREAWASLVLLSADGIDWSAQVLTDFAIYQVVPFGDGLLAAAALPPESDTEMINVDGVTTEVASAVTNRLYYSDDGLTWREVANSPQFGKPLLAVNASGDVIAVDEFAAEDRAIDTTTVYVVSRGG